MRYCKGQKTNRISKITHVQWKVMLIIGKTVYQLDSPFKLANSFAHCKCKECRGRRAAAISSHLWRLFRWTSCLSTRCSLIALIVSSAVCSKRRHTKGLVTLSEESEQDTEGLTIPKSPNCEGSESNCFSRLLNTYLPVKAVLTSAYTVSC